VLRLAYDCGRLPVNNHGARTALPALRRAHERPDHLPAPLADHVLVREGDVRLLPDGDGAVFVQLDNAPCQSGRGGRTIEDMVRGGVVILTVLLFLLLVWESYAAENCTGLFNFLPGGC
jgi:hypothetical protein